MEELTKTQPNKIFLIDRSTKLDGLFSLWDGSEKIITFDFESHKSLLEKNISHEISDGFLTDLDKSSIQNNSYKYAKWFDDDSFSKLLSFDGINLGESSKIESHYFLLPFLKKFLEIRGISKLNPNSKFFAAGILGEITKQFTHNIDVLAEFIPENLLYDHVNFNLKIGPGHLKLSISSKYYRTLKNSIEIILDVFFGPKRRFSKNKKSILLVESNTMAYEEFLLEFGNSNMNLLLYNSRRPYVWNLKTFLILMRSKSIILQNKFNSSQSTNSEQFDIFDYDAIASPLAQNLILEKTEPIVNYKTITPTTQQLSPKPANGTIYSVSTDLVVASGFGVYTEDEIVYQGTSLENATFKGTVLYFDEASNVIKLINTTGTMTLNAPIFGDSSKTTRTLLSYSTPNFVPFSGHMIYIENRSAIQRSADGIEQIKLVLGY